MSDDKDLFKKSMCGVMPLKSDTKHHYRTPAPKPQKRPLERYDDDSVTLDQDLYVAGVESEDKLYFHRVGIQPRTLRTLRQGKLDIEAELDLHGYKRQQAEDALLDFMRRALARNLRVVHVIHGKGLRSAEKFPPLKNSVNAILQRLPDVLAFCSAPVHQGGKGAVNVLLRRQRDDEFTG